MDYVISWGSIAGVQTIMTADEFGPRQFWAIYLAEGKPADISPMGCTPYKVTHAFPRQVREFIDARFRDMFALPVDARQTAIDAHRATGPVTFEALRLTRVNVDSNGNPRRVFHYLQALTRAEIEDRSRDISASYAVACKRANRIGGRRFHTRAYGGGIVVQTYSVDELAADMSRLTGRNYYPIED